MYNFFKNFIIAFLVVLAVYQTKKLWFEDFSSHNFFYTVIQENMPGMPVGQTAEIKNDAEYAAVSCGNNRFALFYNNEDCARMRQIAVKAASAALAGGETAELDEYSFKTAIEEDAIIIKFAFLMNVSDFSGLYGVSAGEPLPKFDSVAVKAETGGDLRTVFFNSENLEGTEIELKKYSGAAELKSLVDSISLTSEGVYYVSSIQNNYDVFTGNEFIPTWVGEAGFNSITKNSPLGEGSAVNSAAVDRYVNAYFDNPVLKWTSVTDECYTFSDEATVVKYYPVGVMEYASYSAGAGGKSVSLSEGLAAAESFLDYEPNFHNDYYLTGYEYEDNKIVFYFDYKVNNFTLSLSEELKEKLGMKGFVEVTVDGGRVSRYKRYLTDYTATIKDPVYTEKSFLEVIDNGLNRLEGESVNSLKLAYLEMGEETVPFCYVAKIDGKEYIETAF